MIAELERQTRELALALNVVGLMNVQYAIKDGDIYILEVNPRASRTVPFVAKVIGLPIAKIAARVMAGETLASFKLEPLSFDLKTSRHVGVKEAVFPFARFGDKVDTVLGPEMKSTGEVMGLDRDYASPSPRASSAAAPACRSKAPFSSRCATATSRRFWSRSRRCEASDSR